MTTGSPSPAAETPEVKWPLGMHPLIIAGCRELFRPETYGEAVAKSFRIARDKLREVSGHEKGSDAFGKAGLHIRGAAAPHVDLDFNDGVKFLLMSIDMFRNEKSLVADRECEWS